MKEETKLLKTPFGYSAEGKQVYRYTLSNANGLEVTIMNLGATLVELKFPDHENNKTDLVLGFPTLENYLKAFETTFSPYFGAVVGRFAGRINAGKCDLNGQAIHLSKNFKGMHLHGGFNGFSSRYWNEIAYSKDELVLEYISAENEEGFPGQLTVRAAYTINADNELTLALTAESSADTIVNLTQHSYFNMNGHAKDVCEQTVVLNADQYLETTAALLPTGKVLDVTHTPFDFRQSVACPTRIDSTFVLNKQGDYDAVIRGSHSRISMQINTNQPAIHLYVGGDCQGELMGKEGVHYHSRSGICFEAQQYPDAPNQPTFPSVVLRKGALYVHTTRYRFSVE